MPEVVSPAVSLKVSPLAMGVLVGIGVLTVGGVDLTHEITAEIELG